MKTVQLTDEKYQHLVGLGIIKEGIKPFKHTKYVKINSGRTDWWYNKHIGEVFEVKFGLSEYYDVIGPNINHPKQIHYQDCIEVEPPTKELKAWEKYPTLESCWKTDGTELAYDVSIYGKILNDKVYADYYHYSTEAEAKRARATVKLSRIARKWNEGVDADKDNRWLVVKNDNIIEVCNIECKSWMGNLSPFYFNTKELAEKSFKLFEQDWKDFYGK